MFAVKGKIPLSYEGAYISNCKTLSWMGNNTKKMLSKPSTSTTTSTSTPSAVERSLDALAIDSFPPASFGAAKGAKEQIRSAGTFSYASAASKGATSTSTAPTPAAPVLGKQTPSKHSGGKDSGADNEVECWTLTSTREFGAANKVAHTFLHLRVRESVTSDVLHCAIKCFSQVPQENVPPEKEREIASLMLRAMEQATGMNSAE